MHEAIKEIMLRQRHWLVEARDKQKENYDLAKKRYENATRELDEKNELLEQFDVEFPDLGK